MRQHVSNVKRSKNKNKNKKKRHRRLLPRLRLMLILLMISVRRKRQSLQLVPLLGLVGLVFRFGGVTKDKSRRRRY